MKQKFFVILNTSVSHCGISLSSRTFDAKELQPQSAVSVVSLRDAKKCLEYKLQATRAIHKTYPLGISGYTVSDTQSKIHLPLLLSRRVIAFSRLVKTIIRFLARTRSSGFGIDRYDNLRRSPSSRPSKSHKKVCPFDRRNAVTRYPEIWSACRA